MANEVASVIASLKAIAAQITSVPVFWRNDNNVLPDPPAAFIFFEFESERGSIAGYGSGRGNNLYRYPGEVLGWLAVERARGLEFGLAIAEPIAALFRSYRDSHVSIFEASVRPITGITDAAPSAMQDISGNYDWYLIEVNLSFDQVG